MTHTRTSSSMNVAPIMRMGRMPMTKTHAHRGNDRAAPRIACWTRIVSNSCDQIRTVNVTTSAQWGAPSHSPRSALMPRETIPLRPGSTKRMTVGGRPGRRFVRNVPLKEYCACDTGILLGLSNGAPRCDRFRESQLALGGVGACPLADHLPDPACFPGALAPDLLDAA